MDTLRSYVCGEWHEATTDFVPLVDPSTEEVIAQVSSAGLDFAGALDHARDHGGPALRRMSFAERGTMLKAMSGAIREHRDELLDLSRRNNGTTQGDGSFDIDGASGTLAYYASLARRLGDATVLPEGDGVQLARTEAFWGQHVLVPRHGVAVAINAFNFPAWGFAEKAACALLAGMPMIVKPATATALVAARCIEKVLASGAVPEGALQMICGATGDLLDRLTGQDVLAFTGSAATAAHLRQGGSVLRANTRVNVEADSLNAAVLAGGSEPGSSTFELFVKDVVREMTHKTGQKCTAARRILVPEAQADAVQAALAERLAAVVTGNPAHESATMGPVANARQLADAEHGVEALTAVAQIVHGNGRRSDGVGSPAGKGFFFPPTLLRAEDPFAAAIVHEHEVFAPVATILPYSGEADAAAEIVALGGGTLVTSVYSDDTAWLERFIGTAGTSTGRIYIGSEGIAGAPGSGAALPQMLHGGPGHAGGGEELGGLVGVRLYMQRVALQGNRAMVDRLAGSTTE